MGWAVLWSDDVNAGCSVVQLFFSLNIHVRRTVLPIQTYKKNTIKVLCDQISQV